LIEVLGPANAPGVDMLSVVRKFDLPVEFPPAVMEEAEGIEEKVSKEELAKREDLRGHLVVTIDPDDARDFDDAINVTTLRNARGETTGWELGVHIADVSHYVRPGTAMDREAVHRGNSTYLADRVLPMLPERLSNGICSLKPHVERLTFSAFMEFTRAGKMKSARFARTVIRSAARLSYRQAFAILQGKEMVPPLPPSLEREARGLATLAEGAPVRIEPAVARAVREAWDLASVLRQRRFENGSLDLDFPEVKVWLDGRGKAVRLEKVENDISHQLIEECMLMANEAVALELKNRLIPAVYRIHENPDPERLQEFRELAKLHGVNVGDLTQRREVQKALAGIRGLPEEYALKLQFLKSLKRAAYSPKPLGHYGLAKVNYAHFTSPIRRYADLVVHRSLARATSSRPAKFSATPAELGQIAEHISETERTSADAEKESVLLKKMEYFQNQLNSRRPDEFRAVVVEVKPFGLLVELPDALMTGMIHVTALPDDYYVYDDVRRCLVGRRTRRRYKMGDQIQVIVCRVDPARRQVDFAPPVG
jgi:ribonuclease R